jgi:glutamate--cysteine ligase
MPLSSTPKSFHENSDFWMSPIAVKPRAIQKMALEMEMLAYYASDLMPFGTGSTLQTEKSVADRLYPQQLFKNLAKLCPNSKIVNDSHTGIITGVQLDDGANFTIEPGGQIELATSPCESHRQLVDEVAHYLNILMKAGEGELVFASHGTNPVASPQLELMLPKFRYQCLTQYFASEKNGRGVDMSRFTATVQPNIDVGGEDWHCAINLTWFLTPFVRHMFSNSFFYQNKRSIYDSERQAIWAHTDSTRTGIPQSVPFTEDVNKEYAKWALEGNVMLIDALPLKDQPRYGELNFQKWASQGYKGIFPTKKDWETHLNTLFPDLRMRGFLEIRSIDAQEYAHTFAVHAFWSGLLKSQSARNQCWQFLGKLIGVDKNAMSTFSCNKAASGDACHTFRDFLNKTAHDDAIYKNPQTHATLMEIALEKHLANKDDLAVKAISNYGRRFTAEKISKDLTAQDFLKSIITKDPAAEFCRYLS